jgi:hypothetical protein
MTSPNCPEHFQDKSAEPQISPLRYAPDSILVLYQGTTSVVPHAAKMVGALAPATVKYGQNPNAKLGRG